VIELVNRFQRLRRRWPRRHCVHCARSIALTLSVLGASSLHAQQDSLRHDSARVDTAADSLRARLERAEAAIALLRQQLAVESGTTVRTRSRIQLELFARVLTNGFLSTSRVNTVDVPQFALADPTTPPAANNTPGTRALGLSVRQTRFGAAIRVDSVLGGVFDGDLDFDLFGGIATGAGDRRLFPELRLRTARARIRWARTELFVGSETPLISDLNPVSLATVGVPGFVAAGNLWNWLPQLRVSRDVAVFASGVRVGIQGAVLTPNSASQHIAEPDAVDAGERSGRPFLQGRVRLQWGDAESRDASDMQLRDGGGEIGFGVHRGWLRASADTLSTSQAYSADARIAITRFVELRGEAYRGTLVRGLGGGAIGQSFGRNSGTGVGRPLRDAAGWLQLNAQPHLTAITGIGCGRDVVDADDRPIREQNTVCAAHVLWRPVQPLVFGFEFRRLQTKYTDRTYRANHVNLSFGFEL
jgi:hypothetical protein